jgi:chemotaxis protein CheX
MKSANPLLAANGSHENWILLLEMAAREVFELMLGCQLIGAPARVGETSLEFTAMVGLAGQLCGLLRVQCQETAAALMTAKMLGVELDQVGPDLSDALGEICNMVAGNFKNKIAGLADGCMLSPPMVITGSNYRLHSFSEFPAIEVRLLFEGMPIVISLQIDS